MLTLSLAVHEVSSVPRGVASLLSQLKMTFPSPNSTLTEVTLKPQTFPGSEFDTDLTMYGSPRYLIVMCEGLCLIEVGTEDTSFEYRSQFLVLDMPLQSVHIENLTDVANRIWVAYG